jgi:hypothetical protein
MMHGMSPIPLDSTQIAALGPADRTPPVGFNRDNAHPRDALLDFYPDAHTYLARGAIPLESVSSLVSRQFPAFDREGTARRVARRDGRPAADILDEWDFKGELARASGTFLHLQIERRLLGLRCETSCKHVFKGARMSRRSEIDVSRELAFFDAWRETAGLAPYRTEWRIFDEEHALAGTVDFIARRADGAFVMVDWKRSGKLVAFDSATGEARPVRENAYRRGLGPFACLADTPFNHYLLQQNLYREILFRHYGIRLDAMYLVVLSPEYDRAWQLAVPFDPRVADLLLA